jgi:glycosyltransferase involved in cell wall biosynthesis
MLRLAARLVQDGHEVLAAMEGEGPLKGVLESAGVKVMATPLMPALHRKELSRPSGWIRLIRNMIVARRFFNQLLRDFCPDIVHTNSAALLPVAGIAARRAGIPHVLHVRESFVEFGPLWTIYRWLLVRSASRVIAISGFVASLFTDRQRKDKVQVIYDGLPARGFEDIKSLEVDDFMQRFNLRRPLVVLAGRIKVKRKGQDVLVRAAGIIKTRHPDVCYALVGSPFPGNEHHLTAVQELIRVNGVDHQVVLTGHLEHPLVAFAAADIAVTASSTPEPLGNVTIEAMALEKPVVGTDCGATGELIRDGVNGRLVPPDDPQAMAAALDELLSDPGRGLAMGRQGRADYLLRFEFEEHYKKILAVYRELAPSTT